MSAAENRFLTAEKIKENTVKLATEIFATLREFRKKTQLTDEEWHKRIVDKYPDFSKTHPTVVRCMTKENMYVESVFMKYLNQLETIQGKGNMALIELQGDYVKELYIAHHKRQGKRYNMSTANSMRRNLIQHMSSFYNEAKKKEEEGKSEYAEKNDEFLQQKKRELLAFIQANHDELAGVLSADNPQNIDTEESQRMRSLVEELGADSDNWSSADIKMDSMPQVELVIQLKKYEDDLLWFMNKINQIHEAVETRVQEAARIQRIRLEEDFLKGTNLEQYRKKTPNAYRMLK